MTKEILAKHGKKGAVKIFDKPILIYLTWILFLSYPLLGFVRYHFFAALLGEIPVAAKLWAIALMVPYISAAVFILTLLYWILIKSNNQLKNDQLRSLYFVGISAAVVFTIGKILLYLENANYANYLYSHIGTEAGKTNFVANVCWIVLVLLIVFIFIEPNIKRKLPYNLKLIIFTMSIFLLSSLNSLTSVNLFWKMVTADPESKYGSQFVYIKALESTPKNVVVVHPPRSVKWPSIGNQAVIRYFLFPRTLVDGKLMSGQEYARQFNEIYFVEVDKDSPETRWPIILSESEEIIFDEENPIKFSKMERYSQINGIDIYSVHFK